MCQAQALLKSPGVLQLCIKLRKTDIRNNRCATVLHYVTNLSLITNISHFSFLVYIDRIFFSFFPHDCLSLKQSSGKLVETFNLRRGIRITDEIIYKLKTDLPNTWGPRLFDVIKTSRKSLILFNTKALTVQLNLFLTDTFAIPTPRR